MTVANLFESKYMTFGIGGDKHPKGWCKCRVYPTHKALADKRSHAECYQYSRCSNCGIVFFRPIAK